MRSGQYLQEQLVAQRHRLFRIARWLVPSDEDAQDVLQDVYLKLWQKQAMPREIKLLDAWLTRIVANACLDFRKRKPQPSEIMGDEPPSNAPSQERKTIANEESRLMLRLLRDLPDPFPLVLQLRHIEEMEISEIVDHTGYTANHVRVLLSRGRKLLKERFEANIHGKK